MQETQPDGLILGVARSSGLTCVSHWQYFNHLGYPREDTDPDEDREDLMRKKESVAWLMWPCTRSGWQKSLLQGTSREVLFNLLPEAVS